MSDPRRPVNRPDAATQDVVREIAYAHLLAVTEEGAKAIGCTVASFVLLGLGIWARELAELDGKASAQMLRALADIYDPAANHTKKAHAEKKRRAAVEKLLAAVDLDVAAPAGRA
ncbi:hypothetical protein [Pseudooceanicola sp.]|jgi:hypothetical protein|uniref:hypothetical protein n=1 Tax=Pseudooceanicola sp. TaxID=1914328 RepID=UPI004057E256